MTLRPLSLLAAALLLPAAVLAAPAALAVPQGPVMPQNDEESPLAKNMGQMGKLMKNLKTALTGEKPDGTAVANHFEKLAKVAGECKTQGADFAKGDEQKKAWAEYLDGVVAESEKGAKAAKGGQWEEAKAAFKALGDLKAKGHKAFIPEEK